MKLRLLERLRSRRNRKQQKEQMLSELKKLSEIIRDCERNGSKYPKHVVERYKRMMLEYNKLKK